MGANDFFMCKIRFRTHIIIINTHKKSRKADVRGGGGGWMGSTLSVDLTLKDCFNDRPTREGGSEKYRKILYFVHKGKDKSDDEIL